MFGRQIRFDLSEGFPLMTTKKMFTKGIIAELLWFLSGDTNEHTLSNQGVNIWKEWAPENGDLGRIYSAQWRGWRYAKDYGPDQGGMRDQNWEIASLDQIANLIQDLKTNPTSRRHIVTAWNPGELDQMALPPCHCLFQFYCEELTTDERMAWLQHRRPDDHAKIYASHESRMEQYLRQLDAPKYRLSCQLYQRSEKSALVA